MIAIILFAVLSLAAAQRGAVDPRNAAILAEARYLSGDGSFGAAYVQDDGVEFKEETDQNGDRKGQYSYVDPNGKKITVHYTAGKNGFQVSGDHLPRAPVPVQAAAPAPQYQPRAPAAPQYNPAPQYNAIPQGNNYARGGADDDGQYRPEIHEHPYQYREGQYQDAAPAQAAPVQHQGFNYQHQAYPQQQQQPQYQPLPVAPTTPQPTRFFPPGKLDLNRTPDGFSFQFQGRQ